MRLEIDCGLRNIFLMSGTVFLPDPYWEAIAAALPELRERAARTPLLALDGVLLTVRCATDLGQLPLWRGILREFLETEENIRL